MRLARAAVAHAHWVVLVVLLGGGWLMLESHGSASASRAVGSGREVMCTYLAQINHLPGDARIVHVWIPLAKTGREQHILRRDVRAPARGATGEAVPIPVSGRNRSRLADVEALVA